MLLMHVIDKLLSNITRKHFLLYKNSVQNKCICSSETMEVYVNAVVRFSFIKI